MAKTNEYPTLTALLAELTEVLNSGDVKATTKKTTARRGGARSPERSQIGAYTFCAKFPCRELRSCYKRGGATARCSGLTDQPIQ